MTDATQVDENSAPDAAKPLLDGLAMVEDLIQKIDKNSGLSKPAQETLLAELRTKREQFEKAANLALGIEFTVSVDAPAGNMPEDAFMAIPGQSFGVNVTATSNNAHPKSAGRIRLTSWLEIETDS